MLCSIELMNVRKSLEKISDLFRICVNYGRNIYISKILIVKGK